MLTQTQTLQLALDVVGVFVFGLSGGLVAVRARLDLFGVLVLAGLATFLFHPSIGRISGFVRMLDAAGLAAFAISGTLKALGLGAAPMTAVFVGELDAVPALLGSALLVSAHRAGRDTLAVVWGCVALVFGIRIVAVVLGLNAPTPLRTERAA